MPRKKQRTLKIWLPERAVAKLRLFKESCPSPDGGFLCDLDAVYEAIRIAERVATADLKVNRIIATKPSVYTFPQTPPPTKRGRRQRS